jgi:hypothetical protein
MGMAPGSANSKHSRGLIRSLPEDGAGVVEKGKMPGLMTISKTAI